jgi:hypothetical protein
MTPPGRDLRARLAALCPVDSGLAGPGRRIDAAAHSRRGGLLGRTRRPWARLVAGAVVAAAAVQVWRVFRARRSTRPPAASG